MRGAQSALCYAVVIVVLLVLIVGNIMDLELDLGGEEDGDDVGRNSNGGPVYQLEGDRLVPREPKDSGDGEGQEPRVGVMKLIAVAREANF